MQATMMPQAISTQDQMAVIIKLSDFKTKTIRNMVAAIPRNPTENTLAIASFCLFDILSLWSSGKGSKNTGQAYSY